MNRHVEEKLDLLESILRDHPEGMKEFELYQLLKTRQIAPFDAENLQDPEVLFRVHFLLFHHLYRLRDRLHTQQVGQLEIHCLEIKLTPTDPQRSEGEIPARHDGLRDYYLDLSHLEQTTRADVEQLLQQFWERFDRFEGRDAALSVLDLPAEADQASIKKRYRSLAKQHHPDSGGDADQFRQIAEAAEFLLTP
ncbi:DNA-J related domain-containing protein [Magnetococcus sp. PR-3]|uniref:DNA-J related domain-containing protein n=1 Tax=Magnetococcus sp. PR-3 TaxID=3120355 RepID=UPI002FCDE643